MSTGASFGLAFETALGFQHNRYMADGLAYVFHAKTAGKFVGKGIFKPLKSLPDYLGLIAPGGRMISFDAKTTGNLTKWKLDKRFTHQYLRLLELDKFGAIAFFLVEARELRKLFAIRVRWSNPCNDDRPYILFKLIDTYLEQEILELPFDFAGTPDYLPAILKSIPFSSTV